MRYLDILGNADGIFKLGDVLAYLDRTHATISGAVMAELDRAQGVQLNATPTLRENNAMTVGTGISLA